MHYQKTLEDCYFLKIMENDAIYISITKKELPQNNIQKDCYWLCFKTLVFLDVSTQQNQVNKYQNIQVKYIFRTQTL